MESFFVFEKLSEALQQHCSGLRAFAFRLVAAKQQESIVAGFELGLLELAGRLLEDSKEGPSRRMSDQEL